MVAGLCCSGSWIGNRRFIRHTIGETKWYGKSVK
jgi:hypothetical protein